MSEESKIVKEEIVKEEVKVEPKIEPIEIKGELITPIYQGMSNEVLEFIKEQNQSSYNDGKAAALKEFQAQALEEKTKAERAALISKITDDEFLKTRFAQMSDINLENETSDNLNKFINFANSFRNENTAKPEGTPVQSLGGAVDVSAIVRNEIKKDKGSK